MLLWIASAFLLIVLIHMIKQTSAPRCPRCNEYHDRTDQDDALDISKKYYYIGPVHPKQKNPTIPGCSRLFIKKSCLNN